MSQEQILLDFELVRNNRNGRIRNSCTDPDPDRFRASCGKGTVSLLEPEAYK